MNKDKQKDSKVSYKKPIRILLTGGGSGGPTLPLIALAEEIIHQNIESKFFHSGSGASNKFSIKFFEFIFSMLDFFLSQNLLF